MSTRFSIFLIVAATSAMPAFAKGESPTSRAVCSILGVYSGSCTNTVTGDTIQNSVQLGFLGGLGYDNGFDWSHCADNYTLQYVSQQLPDSDGVPLDQYPFNGGKLEYRPVVTDLGGRRTSTLWAEVSSGTDFTLHRIDRFEATDPMRGSFGFSHQADTKIHQLDTTHLSVEVSFTLKGNGSSRRSGYHCASLTRTK